MLSVCIPTYNRLPFLEWTLARTKRDFPDAEIVISDNHSTDGTALAPLGNVRYIRQPDNIGPFANLRAALLGATQKYAVYLGDDDYLLPDEVQKGVAWLEAHPNAVGYCAPCCLYNEVQDKADWEAFFVADDETFSDPEKLWNFMLNGHVWPEHIIWRRAGLEKIIQTRVREYWCFIDIANAIMQGPVHFAKTPFYRNITQHPAGNRGKLGDAQCLTDFDEYRGGLEIAAYTMFKEHLKIDKVREQIRFMISHFIAVRLSVALRLHKANGRTAQANATEKRLAVRS
jgi:glycosyltransferase involved in cell wall biosynthesis